jgi:hypothetical protein
MPRSESRAEGTWSRNRALGDTYFKLFIDLPTVCFTATATTGPAETKVA